MSCWVYDRGDMTGTHDNGLLAEPARRWSEPLPYDELARDLTVSHIATGIDQLSVIEADDPVSRVVAVLEPNQFDYAPVRDSDTFVGRVALTTAKRTKSARVRDITEPLAARFLLSANSPISEVIRWLNEEPWLLVVDGKDIAGLVARADLNRQAVRVYFYMLVVDFEVRLSTMLRKRFDRQEELLELLSEQAAFTVWNRYRELKEMDVDIDLVAAMDLSHLSRAFGKSPDLRNGLGYESAKAWKQAVGGIVGFRHQVMHPVRPLLSSQEDHERLIEMDLRLRGLLHRLPAA